MKYFVSLLIILSISSTAKGQKETILAKQIRQEITQLQLTPGYSEFGKGDLPNIGSLTSKSPIYKLIQHGMEAVPYLVPYLIDKTETKAIKVYGRGENLPALTNEYVLFIINQIAAHEFVFPEKQLSESERRATKYIPRDLSDLQTQVHLWWLDNRSRTLLERKIIDLDDPLHLNRFAAYEWLGKSAKVEAKFAVEKKLNTFLAEKYELSSLSIMEINRCAASLAKLNTEQSVLILEKVCEHFSHLLEKSEGSDFYLQETLMAHYLLASAGATKNAVERLEQIKQKYFDGWNEEVKKEFTTKMDSIIAGRDINRRP